MNSAVLRIAVAIENLKNDERGTVMLEYGLVAGLIAITAVVGAGALGGALEQAFQTIITELPGYVPPP